MANFDSQAYKAWEILVELAPHEELITYGDLGRKLGIHWRAVTPILAKIQEYCMKYHLPPLTILVVNKTTRKPGSGFIAWNHGDLQRGRSKVRNWDWTKVSPA